MPSSQPQQAADAEHARTDDLDCPVRDAIGVATVGQGRRQPGDHAGLLLGRPQQQEACVARLVAAIEINCELLARDGWQIEGGL